MNLAWPFKAGDIRNINIHRGQRWLKSSVAAATRYQGLSSAGLERPA
jgi:hypothetical protein